MSTFTTVTTNPGSGGAIFATEQYVSGSDSINVAVSLLAYGTSGGPYSLVGDDTCALPVRISTGTSNIGSLTDITGVISLPTGAAAETTLLAAKVDLDKFTFTSTRLLVDNSGVTQPISGTITANAGTNLNTSLLALEGGNLATIAGAITSSIVQANVAKINNVTPLMGNGVTGTGSLRVTVSSDNTAFSVNANQAGTWNITNVGTFAVQDSQTITDNTGFIEGTSKLFVSGFVYDESAGTALTENDAAAGRINVNRAIVHVLEDGTTRGRYVTVSAANALKVDNSGVTQPISGTITANAGTNLNTSLLALEGGNLATLAGAVTSSIVQANISKLNNVTPLMGNGITGTGSLRVTVASDNTAFTVNAAQSGTWNIGAIASQLPTGTNVIGQVTINQNNPGTTNGVSENAQKTAIGTFQTAAVADGNGIIITTDGYDGELLILVSNGAGTCTLTIQGSLDNFAVIQDIMKVGLYKLADSGAGTNTDRQILSGVISIAANTSYTYLATELYPYMRAVISSASSLGAGSSVTGCTVKVYQVPV